MNFCTFGKTLGNEPPQPEIGIVLYLFFNILGKGPAEHPWLAEWDGNGKVECVTDGKQYIPI